MIEIRKVSVTFQTPTNQRPLVAIQAIDLEISKGKLVSIIGPSGCGKSTLLKVVAGLHRNYEGEVYIEGKLQRGPLPKKIAVVFQEDALFPWKTVLRNVQMGLQFQGIHGEARARLAAQALDLVKLNGFENFYPGQLSGGMRQRVAIARALALSPAILLMDEPFGALDEQTRMYLGEELMSILEATGKTIVFVTHSLTEAVYLSDRIAVMTARPGQIKECIDVGLPHPREANMMTSQIFNTLRNRLFDLLHDELKKTMDEQEVSRTRRSSLKNL